MENHRSPDGAEVDEKFLHLHQELAQEWGIDFHRMRALLCRMMDGNWHSIGDLVQIHAISHRTVTHLVRRLEPWLESQEDRVRGREEYNNAFISVFDCAGTDAGIGAGADPYETAARSSAGLASMIRILQGLPRSVRDLDHVSATPLTCIKRALFLGENYDLKGAQILCLGDHDLTSAALCLLYPDLHITVVDVDEPVLEYIHILSAQHGWNIRSVFADLRIELPRSLTEHFDLVFTDPPYAPGGVKLFLKRGLESLKRVHSERIFFCYGFGEHHPGLGFKVQSAVHELRLVLEAILPGFNRYDGAEAIGGSSALYICRPTRRSWSAAKAARVGAKIYTQGKSAAETGPEALPRETSDKIQEYVAQYGGDDPTFVGAGWPAPIRTASISLSGYLRTMYRAQGKPPFTRNPHAGLVAVNLYPEYAGYLARLPLVAAAEFLIMCVADKAFHAVFMADGDSALKALVESKYQILAASRGTHLRPAIVVLQQAPPAATTALQYVLRYIVDHRHARLGNAWREALVSWFVEHQEATLTKNQARRIIDESPLAPSFIQGYLAELPLQVLATLAPRVEHTIQKAPTLKET